MHKRSLVRTLPYIPFHGCFGEGETLRRNESQIGAFGKRELRNHPFINDAICSLMVGMLHIQLLDGFLLTADSSPLSGFHQPRMQSLLVYLLLHRHRPQSRQQIAFLFWPDTTEKQAHTNLRKLIHSLRRALPELRSSSSRSLQRAFNGAMMLRVRLTL